MRNLNKIINEQHDQIVALKKELLDWKIRHQETSTSLGEVCQHAERLERELKNAENRVDTWKEQVNEMRETQFRRFNNEECWIYQGDGEDYPESLICPVVISAEQLRVFLAAEKRLAEAEREMDELETDLTALSIATGRNETWKKGRKLQNKRDIEQQIKALEETLRENSRSIAYPHGDNTDVIYTDDIKFDMEQLRQQLNKKGDT